MSDAVERAHIYQRGILAGTLERGPGRVFHFTYTAEYLELPDAPAVSLTLPRRHETYTSEVLFPFFSGLLSEGPMRVVQCRTLRIDERDDFTLLLKAGLDTVGSVSILEDDGGPPPLRLGVSSDG